MTTTVQQQTSISPDEAKAVAQDGYIFGLPPVYIGVQADMQTNVAKPEGGRAPFNQFDNHREFPDAKNNKIVGMNVDTLYSLANVDLTAEPIVLVVPPMEGNRWWIMQIIDLWNDVPRRPAPARTAAKGGTLRSSVPTSQVRSPQAWRRSASTPVSPRSAGGRTPAGRPITPRSTRFRTSTS